LDYLNLKSLFSYCNFSPPAVHLFSSVNGYAVHTSECKWSSGGAGWWSSSYVRSRPWIQNFRQEVLEASGWVFSPHPA